MSEQYSNAPTTTLNGDITNVATSLIVTSATGFPTAGNFRIIIDSEIMLVTAVSGTTFTITRASEGTTGASHLSGATIAHILTAGALDQVRIDLSGVGLLASRPSASKTGNLWLPTDGTCLAQYNGSNWANWGHFYPLDSAINLANYAWVNQSTATAVQQGDAVYMVGAIAAADNLYFVKKAYPALPASFVLDLIPCLHLQNFCGAGIILYDTGSGKCGSWMLWCNASSPQNGLVWQVWNSPTSGVTAPYVTDERTVRAPIRKLKVRDDGTTLHFYISTDGVNFLKVLDYTKAATTVVNVNSWGFGLYNSNGSIAPTCLFQGASEIAG